MKLYTSYFSRWKQRPGGISIALKTPHWHRCLQYPPFFPSSDILFGYKRNHDEELYIKRYTNEILNNLDPEKVKKDLLKMKAVALLCWEASDKFCHRHIVANYLKEKCDIEIEEWDGICEI